MNKKTIQISAIGLTLAIIVLAVLFASGSFNRSEDYSLLNDLVLSKDKAIQARARLDNPVVHKGDLFSYIFEVWYDPRKVAEIDQSNLEKSINLSPFEIKQVKEQDVRLNSSTRVYRKEYTLQLVTGKAGQLYDFPEMLVRYQAQGVEGVLSVPISTESVFVAPRLGPDVRDLVFGYGPLRPIMPKIDTTSGPLPWVFWALGIVLAASGVFVSTRQSARNLSEVKTGRKKQAEGDVVFQSYRSLIENHAMATDPRSLLHQMDHVLRILLVQREKVDLLAGLDQEKLPSAVREQVSRLLAICNRAYNSRMVEAKDVEEGLLELHQVLEYYYGRKEVVAWRDFSGL